MLRQIAISMNWRTNICFQKIQGLRDYIGFRGVPQQSSVSYLNIDLAKLQSSKAEPIIYTHDSICELPPQICSQLKNFLLSVESDIVLGCSALRQFKEILSKYESLDDQISRQYLLHTRTSNSPQNIYLSLIDIFGVIHSMFSHGKGEINIFDLSREFASSIPPLLQAETIEKLIQYFGQFCDYFSCPHFFNEQLKKLATEYETRSRPWTDQPGFIDQKLVQHLFFFVTFIADLPLVADVRRQIFGIFETGFEFFVLLRTRYLEYATFLDNELHHFFSPSEWSQRIDRTIFQKNTPSLQAPTLTRFLEQLFDPSSKKARIFLQSGKTESGKTFTTSAWTSLLFQLNGTVLGSRIDGDFVRVSDLGSRHLKIIEEYKGNLPAEFYHLESNSKQLYDTNARIDPRLSLVMINCDKQPYSLDQEQAEYAAKLISRGEPEEIALANALSRREQVESRTFILNWTDPNFKLFKEKSLRLKSSNHAIKMYFMNLSKQLPEFLPSDWISIPVAHDEIILRWDSHLQREMKYLTILDCWGDLLAWAQVLFRCFSLNTTGVFSDHPEDLAYFDDREAFVERLSRLCAVSYISRTPVGIDYRDDYVREEHDELEFERARLSPQLGEF